MNFATALALALIVVLIYRATYQGRSWTIAQSDRSFRLPQFRAEWRGVGRPALANISASHSGSIDRPAQARR